MSAPADESKRPDLRRIGCHERAVGILFTYLAPIAPKDVGADEVRKDLSDAVSAIIEAAALRAVELRQDEAAQLRL